VTSIVVTQNTEGEAICGAAAGGTHCTPAGRGDHEGPTPSSLMRLSFCLLCVLRVCKCMHLSVGRWVGWCVCLYECSAQSEAEADSVHLY